MSNRTDPYAAWRFGAYRLLMLARAAFFLGMQMLMAAVGWQLYERLGSKMALAWVGLIEVIPVILLSLLAGHIADRFNRRLVLLLALALVLACSVAMALLSWVSGPVWLIYLVLFFLAVARAFTFPTMAALLPAVVPREAWNNATTWSSTIFELASMVGPAAAGGLIAASGGATLVYLATAGCALACLVFVGLLRPRPAAHAAPSATLRDLVAGFRFMWNTKLLLGVVSLDLFAVLLGGATALMPVVAKDILHLGPAGFGWLRAAPSVGAIVMALITAHLPPWRHAGRVLLGAFIGFGVATVLFGISRNFWFSMVMLAVTGACDNLNVVIRHSLAQFITPDEMRGRVSAINAIFIGCSNELGAFESGLTAHVFGTVPSIVGGGLGALLVAVMVASRFPQILRLGSLQSIHPAAASGKKSSPTDLTNDT